MKNVLKFIVLLVLMTSRSVVHAEDDKIIMSTSDAASVISDRYAKKNSISTEVARHQLTEAGVFRKADVNVSRIAEASVKAQETTVPTAVVPVEKVTASTAATRPAIVTDKSAAKVAPVVVANNKPVQTQVNPEFVTPVVSANVAPDTTPALLVAAPVALPPSLSGAGFAMWQWLILFLLIPLILFGWFKKRSRLVVAAAPAMAQSEQAQPSAVHVDNLSFYVPDVLDHASGQRQENQLDSNPASGIDLKTSFSKTHNILVKVDEGTVAPLNDSESAHQEMTLSSLVTDTLPKRSSILPRALTGEADEVVAFGRSREQHQNERLFGTQLKTPASRLRDLVSSPTSA